MAWVLTKKRKTSVAKCPLGHQATRWQGRAVIVPYALPYVLQWRQRKRRLLPLVGRGKKRMQARQSFGINAALLVAAALVCNPAGAQVDAILADSPTAADAPAQTAPANGYYSNSPQAMAFADKLAAQYDLPPDAVRNIVGQARFSPAAQRLMRPSHQSFFKNWRVYRSRFVEPIRINAGLRFWQANRATLERAEEQYGVPQEVILGILGVETLYGRDMGSFRVIDVLATLGFDFPKTAKRDRSEFFQNELASFLRQQMQAGRDPLQPKGSYAGAMGMGQFMPSSLQNFAVDFDGDGQIDLSAPADAIGSVAHYFQAYGWKRGQQAIFDVQLAPDAQMDKLLAPDILPSFSVKQMQALGAQLPEAAQNYKGSLALIELQNGDPAQAGNGKTYYAGTDNFYAITRYNQSSYYAMSVLDLGAAIREKAGF
jgi:membrane-bound lytic murein transglycosylase B